MVEPIGEMLGADHVIATRMEIVDGKYTGKIDYYAYAEEKARAIERPRRDHGYDLDECYAYSDSVTDVHMLEVVGHPFAVNPDKELRRIAPRTRLAGAELRAAGRAALAGAAPAGAADARRARGGRCDGRWRRAVGQSSPPDDLMPPPDPRAPTAGGRSQPLKVPPGRTYN